MNETDSGVWDNVVNYLGSNITKNVKQLMATLGSMVLTLIATILFILKSGFTIQDALIIILLELQPFCYIYIKLIFSGETHLKDQEIMVLKEKLGNMQEISEYKIRLAARDAIVTANNEWVEINKKLEQLELYIKKE